jgi:Flp pilus assembly protein TadG
MTKRMRMSSDRGAVLVIVAIVLPVLLAMSALAIDLGVLYMATEQAQNAADAAALAAVGRLREDMSFDATAIAAAQQEAIAVAAANRIMNTPVVLTADNVQVGEWKPATKTLIPWTETATNVAAQVTVRRTDVPTYFAKILGKQFMTTSRTAVASLSIDKQARHSKSVMVVQDGSSSFQGRWNQAIDADTELLRLINTNSIDGDQAGFTVFTSALSPADVNHYLAHNHLTAPVGDIYWNSGVKYTTDSQMNFVATNPDGTTGGAGPKEIRRMWATITDYDGNGSQSVMPPALTTASSLLKNGNAAGWTDTAAGLTYAINKLLVRQSERIDSSTTDMVIVLVSDGVPCAPSDNALTCTRSPNSDTRALMQNARDEGCRAKDLGIRLHTVTLEGTYGTNFAFNESLRCGGDGTALRGAADGSDLLALLNFVGTIELGHSTLVK